VIERLKDTFVIVAGAREIKAVNTSLFGTSRNSKLKFTRREALLLNQLANNLKSKTGNVWNHIFDQTVGNRAITELINR
jgi:hypothetical protein